MDDQVRVLLADDHPLIRTGIGTLVESVPDLTVVGEATDGTEVVQRCTDLRPDVVVLDLSMPGPTPVETIAQLRVSCPDTKILILSAFDDDAYVRGVTQAGVVGYVLKDEATESVIRAIRTFATGGTWFSRSVMEKLVHPGRDDQAALASGDLTEREIHLLHLFARGRDNIQISVELHLAEQTVRNYMSRLYSKLGVSSRAEAIVWAKDHGFGDT